MSSLESWAFPRLQSLLPLDDESLKQIITYTAQLSPGESATHLQNLLGEDSPGVLEFISGFNSRRPRSSTGNTGAGSQGQGQGQGQEQGQGRSRQDAGNRSKGKKELKKKSGGPLRASDSPRRPDGYGDISGGYVKSKNEDYMTATSRSAEASRNQSPAGGGKVKAPPSAQGPLISDYLPNVRSKQATKQRAAAASSRSGSPASSSSNNNNNRSSALTTTTTTTTTTNNIADLTAAIAALEVSTNPSQSQKKRKCNCNASIHPLFTPAPNCVACGKIICALEGLQPCSFCGAAILSPAEVQDMIRELRAERGNERMRAHNKGARPSGNAPAPVSSASSASVNDSSTSDLAAARAHRDKLLAFQAQNAQRTHIIDEAADFDVPSVSSTQWMSPAQRALALKKQQRILREMEDKARPEWEKRSMVMSLDVKKGKVVKTFEHAAVQNTPVEVEEEGEGEVEGGGSSRDTHVLGSGEEGAFSNNPLLKGAGLVRPVWKASSAKPVQERRREQRQTWRRVQDDHDDNERWILDGGTHGYEEVEVQEDGQRPGVSCG